MARLILATSPIKPPPTLDRAFSPMRQVAGILFTLTRSRRISVAVFMLVRPLFFDRFLLKFHFISKCYIINPMSSIVYPIGDSLYLNITNRCTNECSFCIRYKTDLFNQQYPLWLEHEPSAEEVIEAIGNPTKYKQIVFCGYGEPTIRLDVIKEVAKKLKSKLTTHP